MKSIRGGEFWVANIPFTDGTSSKKRPILILWIEGDDAVVAAVTSAKPRTITDVVLHDWANSGLLVPSTVRLSRLDCLEMSLFRKNLGKLSTRDGDNILKVWSNQVRPQF